MSSLKTKQAQHVERKLLHPNQEHVQPTSSTDDTPIDVNGDIVYVPQTTVTNGLREASSKDGSYYFKLFGGPYHDHTIRVYPPYTEIVFKGATERHTYTVHPPLSKSGLWVYVHTKSVPL